MARSLLKSKGIPSTFGAEAVSTAMYLLNQAPTKSIMGKTSYEAWYKEKPNVHHLRMFGCVAHVKVMKPHLPRMADWSIRTVHAVGIRAEHQGSSSHTMSCSMRASNGTRAPCTNKNHKVMFSQLCVHLVTP